MPDEVLKQVIYPGVMILDCSLSLQEVFSSMLIRLR